MEKEQDIVTENDLDHLLQLLEGRDEPAEWQGMMQRSTPNFAYEAWRLEPEVWYSAMWMVDCVSYYKFEELSCIFLFFLARFGLVFCHFLEFLILHIFFIISF